MLWFVWLIILGCQPTIFSAEKIFQVNTHGVTEAQKLCYGFIGPTSITLAPERDRQEIKAAICHPVTLTAKPQARTGRDTMNRPTVVQQATFSFPGILTERYFNSEEDEVFRRSTLERVLVAPKAVVLRVGDLVQLGDTAPYTVLQRMDLEFYKNEYVLERREDV